MFKRCASPTPPLPLTLLVPAIVHDSVHGADVTQTAHTLLVNGCLGTRLSPLEILSFLVAATAHDVGALGTALPRCLALEESKQPTLNFPLLCL
jgi:hypothetical protein